MNPWSPTWLGRGRVMKALLAQTQQESPCLCSYAEPQHLPASHSPHITAHGGRSRHGGCQGSSPRLTEAKQDQGPAHTQGQAPLALSVKTVVCWREKGRTVTRHPPLPPMLPILHTANTFPLSTQAVALGIRGYLYNSAHSVFCVPPSPTLSKPM